MKTLFIIKSLLSPYRHKYLRDGNYYDYLGQILVQLGYDIPDKCRTPEDLKTNIPNFTSFYRGAIRNSILSTRIMRLDNIDPTQHPQKMADLLTPIGITLEWKK